MESVSFDQMHHEKRVRIEIVLNQEKTLNVDHIKPLCPMCSHKYNTEYHSSRSAVTQLNKHLTSIGKYNSATQHYYDE